MKLSHIYFLVLSILPFYNHCEKKADLIIFSYNRPMQLHALLQTVEKNITGINETIVIYRASTPEYERAYQKVENEFSAVFMAQKNPPYDFKPLTLAASFNLSDSEYVVYAVDDIVITNTIDFASCIEELEKHDGYGVFLRLGLNLSYCYMLDSAQPIPPYQQHETCNSWRFADGLYDWNYPHTLDMTLYRKKDIIDDFYSMEFTSPNQLEFLWANRVDRVLHKKGIFFNTTKIVNIPLNRVQTYCNNRSMDEYTPEELLELYNQGYRIDCNLYYGMLNKAAHEPMIPQFKTSY